MKNHYKNLIIIFLLFQNMVFDQQSHFNTVKIIAGNAVFSLKKIQVICWFPVTIIIVYFPRIVQFHKLSQCTIVFFVCYMVFVGMKCLILSSNRPTGPIWSSSREIHPYPAGYQADRVSCPLTMQFFQASHWLGSGGRGWWGNSYLTVT